MKTPIRIPSAIALAALVGLSLHTATAQVVFSESFEAPVVTGYARNTVPSGGNWIGSTAGFNAVSRGLYNEKSQWPATPPFSTPYGEQAYFLNYANSGLTTAVGATGQTLTSDVDYQVTFHAAAASGYDSANYRVELVAFGPDDDNVARRECRGGRPGAVLAVANGSVTTNDMSSRFTINFTADGANAHLGKDLGIRLIYVGSGSGTSCLYDNIRLITGHDIDPSPANGEALDVAGNVTLKWTNLPPVAPATTTPVDVWFGDNLAALTQVVDGQPTSSTVVSAPTAGTWYWRVDSYPDGDANGTPVTGQVFSFTIADTDGDGLPDWWEIQYFGGPTAADANADPDNDGLTNLEEFIRGTDPTNPDTDGDGLPDGVETATGIWVSPNDTGTHPLNPDTDGDGLLDGVETNTGIWVGPHDTGTDPLNPDTDGDGLVDGVETNTGVFVSRFDTGTNPHIKDTDGDGVWDYYEVAAAFTDPNDPNDTPSVPYPLPRPDGSAGATDKPVKVYIIMGQSNATGIGRVNGIEPGTLETIAKREHRFPNLVDDSNNWLPRNDVLYRRAANSSPAAGPLAPGQGGSSSQIGPELGFGQMMGWYHDEPVLILKASQGNRSLGGDFLPPGSPRREFEGRTFAAYGESPASWLTGTTPVPTDWVAGRQYNTSFLNPPDNAPAILADFNTYYPQWASQGYEIGGFVWFQGHFDQLTPGYAEYYQENLVNYINAVRAEFNAPDAPFVVATIGFGGEPLSNKTVNFQKVFNAQMAVQDLPQFTGTVKSVDTLKFWRTVAESPKNEDYHYNQNAETYVLVGDAAGRAMIDLLDDTSPPSPINFRIPPTPQNPGSIGMVATTAKDTSGPVEYWFEIIGGTNSGWTTSTNWEFTGLADGQSYDFRFKARDAVGNESDWSATASATASAAGDTTAPSPNPMSFTGPLTVLGENAIAMTATTASDINGVEYEFVCTAGGGPSSGWQASAQFTATALEPATTYTYIVRARDGAGNITADSDPATATTIAPDTTPPAPATMSFDTPPTALGIDAITMTATTAIDPSGVEYYFEETSGNAGGSDSGWQDSPTYVNNGLQPGTTYTYRVRARDKSPAQNANDWSAEASATTEVPDTTPPSVVSFDPPNGATDVSIGTTLEIIFDEEIVAATGFITLKNLTDNTETAINITDDSQVSVEDTMLTIDPTSDFDYSKNYAIQIAPTAIEDLAGNSFAGIGDDTSWSFTTADPPVTPLAIIYEPFAETAGSLGGKAGGLGLSGNWSVNQTFTVENPSSLAYADVPNSGGQVNNPSGNASWAAISTTTALSNAGLLDHGATLWFSYVFMNTAGGGSNEHTGFAFATERVSPGSTGLNLSAAGDGFGVYIRNSTATASSWSNSTARAGGTSVGLQTYGTPTFVIGKIVWGEEEGDHETLTIWTRALNDIATEPTIGGGVRTVAAFDQTQLDTISFGQRNSGGTHTYDEIRFGATYGAVIGQGSSGPGQVDRFEISPIASPQTVGTPITGITITAQDASDATATYFNGTVTFGGTGGFSGTSGTFTDGVLTGVSVTPTVAGSDLTFTVVDGSGHTGFTTIAAIDPAAAGFDAWAAQIPDVNLRGRGDDADGDGFSNLQEFLFGTSPVESTGSLTTIETSGSDLIIRWKQRTEGAAYTLQQSTTLANDWVPSNIVPVNDGSAINGYQPRMATVPTGSGKLFLRIQGVEN